MACDALRIVGGRVVDPFTGRDESAEVCVAGGRFASDAPSSAVTLDASGWIVSPGLMDIHVHLREPGQPHKETIASGTAAAAAGGFTLVACMPNTNPPVDSPEVVRWIVERAEGADNCAVGPIACITQGRRGEQVTDFAALREAGAVAFSDDGDGVEDDRIMSLAFERAARLDAVLIQHCEYRGISAGGVMHAGGVARRLGFPGLDPRSEDAMIERDVALCRQHGARYHVAHISTARGVALVRQAKADGLPVTAEVTPHHLILTEEACAEADPNTKMHPPLRTSVDVDACRKGLLDGTIDCVATDHAPHAPEEKARGFLDAPPGVAGLETAIGVCAAAMVASGLTDWPQLLRWLTSGPARVLGIRRAGMEVGAPADLTLMDPDCDWVVDAGQFASKGRNTPFSGWRLRGRARGAVRGRQVLMRQ